MAENPLVEQAKDGNVSAIASLMNRLLKSQGMLANVERDGDHLEVLIESDLRSLDDEMRIPKRQVLIGMLRKWFLTIGIQNVSSVNVSWQQAGAIEPAWTETVVLRELNQEVNQNSGFEEPQESRKIPPLPVFSPKPMAEYPNPEPPQAIAPTPDLDEMFGGLEESDDTPSASLRSEVEPVKTPANSVDLFLSDVPVIPDLPAPSSSNQENTQDISPSQGFSWRSLLTTPSLPMQFIQYGVTCAIILVGLRGIHTALGSNAHKTKAIAPHVNLIASTQPLTREF
ncbi:MAG: hypothetical protein NW214_11150 [Pseudanabaenaceae cyanobacterium bins.39]|nr:hypothetical protein [Pseudanabaenaceae cyanobacterium bins.39]